MGCLSEGVGITAVLCITLCRSSGGGRSRRVARIGDRSDSMA
jgi:hypothetical protein